MGSPRRQTYYAHRKGHRPEQRDEELSELLRRTASRFTAWGLAAKLIQILDRLVEWRGAPEYIRCDNGPEFIAGKLQHWALRHGVELRYIQPGKPTQNGLIERFNKTLRAECLNLSRFTSLAELNAEIQDWSVIYNHQRPHRNLGYRSPITHENRNKNFYFRVVPA